MQGLMSDNRRMFGAMLSHLDEAHIKLTNNSMLLLGGQETEKAEADDSGEATTTEEPPLLKNLSSASVGTPGPGLLKVDGLLYEKTMGSESSGCASAPCTTPSDASTKTESAPWTTPSGESAVDLEAQNAAQNAAKKAVPCVDHEQRGLTVAEATFCLSNYLMNFGLFSVPAVFVMCGWEALGLIALVAGACMVTAAMLSKVLERLSEDGLPHATYGDIARAASGPGVAWLLGVTGLAEVTMYAVGNFIVLAQTLSDLVDALDFRMVVMASSALTILASAIPDRVYSYLAFFSALSLSMSCATVVASGLELPQWAEAAVALGPPSRLPLGFSILVFGAAAHPCLPSIYNAAGSREVFDRAVVNSWTIWGLFACAFGLAVWCMLGDTVRMIATRNIGFDIHNNPVPAARGLAAFSACWLLVKLQGSQVPATRPMTEAFAKSIGVRLPRGNGGWRCMVVSAPMVLIAAALADVLQDRIRALESMSGGVLMSINAFIFPAFAYVQVCKPDGLVMKVFSTAAASLGMALCAFTISSAGQ